jgi:hypothetical protein
LCRANEPRNVEISRKVELPRVLLVHIPRAIGFDRVAAAGAHFFKNIAPGVGHIAEIVHGTRNQLYGLTVFYKIFTFYFKSHGFLPPGFSAVIITENRIIFNVLNKKEKITKFLF